MAVLKEFRDFAVKGNVVDLAVGIIIGGAFGKIVDSLVNDIVMPVISSLLGGKIDFTNLFIVLGNVPDGVPHSIDAFKKAGIPIFAYGNFITISINFIFAGFRDLSDGQGRQSHPRRRGPSPSSHARGHRSSARDSG